MNTPNYERKYYFAQMERLLLEFDFYKVYDIMTHLSWKWSNKKDEKEYSPSVEDLKSCARELLTGCIDMASQSDNKRSYISCGGLTSVCDIKEGCLSLYFEPVTKCIIL